MNEIKLQLYLLLLCNFSLIGKINWQNTTWAHSWSDILNEDLHSHSLKTQVARMRRLFTILIYHYFQTAYSNNRSTSALQHKEPSKYHDLYRITDVHPFINVFESCHEMLRPSSSYMIQPFFITVLLCRLSLPRLAATDCTFLLSVLDIGIL